MEELNPVSVDTAVILDEQVQTRVSKIAHAYLQKILPPIISEELDTRFSKEKEKMMVEIAIMVGKILRQAEDEDRKPLWETDIAEFGFPAVTTINNISRVKNGVQE
jgi:hypothetical protein